jgi:hypothetical protein
MMALEVASVWGGGMDENSGCEQDLGRCRVKRRERKGV